MEKIVYMDHAATTPVDPEVVTAMEPYIKKEYGNPSSLYSIGRVAKAAIEDAREKVAVAIGAKPEEIIFVSCGTEADNLAIEGVAFANESRGNHIISTPIEHHAVLHCLEFLKRRGFEVTLVPVDNHGVVDPEDVRAAITDKTVLITVMHANNEIGTIQPIAEIGAIAQEREIYFHTDAVQTVGAIPVDVNELGVDLLALSGHKLYAPKGIGAAYVKKGTRMTALLHGGNQERRRRAGTENVAGIVGLGRAVELAVGQMEQKSKKFAGLRDKLITGILDSIDDVRLNGHPTARLPNNVSVCIELIEGESILLNLDQRGICASSGSACTSATLEPSHVLLAIGVPIEIAHGSLRLSLGRLTRPEDVDTVLSELPPIIDRLRSMSPLYSGKGGSKDV